MFDTLVVIVIVAGAAWFVARRFLSLGKGGGCGCSGGGDSCGCAGNGKGCSGGGRGV